MPSYPPPFPSLDEIFFQSLPRFLFLSWTPPPLCPLFNRIVCLQLVFNDVSFFLEVSYGSSPNDEFFSYSFPFFFFLLMFSSGMISDLACSFPLLILHFSPSWNQLFFLAPYPPFLARCPFPVLFPRDGGVTSFWCSLIKNYLFMTLILSSQIPYSSSPSAGFFPTPQVHSFLIVHSVGLFPFLYRHMFDNVRSSWMAPVVFRGKRSLSLKRLSLCFLH